jgi:hypothetical protein
LALNTQSVVIDFSEKEQMDFFKKYSNPISIYKDAILDEWSTRLMIRQPTIINKKEEKMNVITIITKALHEKIVGEKLQYKDGLSVELDINTVPDNVVARFSGGCLQEFIESALYVWDEIWSELL